jgi:hypothetical protein
MRVTIATPATPTAAHATAIAEHVSASGGFERLTHPRRRVDYSREGLAALLVREDRLSDYAPAAQRVAVRQMTAAEKAEVVTALADMLCERP